MALNQAKLSNALNNIPAEMPKSLEITNFYLAISKFGLYPCPKNAFYDFVFPNVCEPKDRDTSMKGFYILQNDANLSLFYKFVEQRIEFALEFQGLNPTDFRLQIDHQTKFLTGSALSSLPPLTSNSSSRSIAKEADIKAEDLVKLPNSERNSALLRDQRGLPSPCQTYFPFPSSRFEWNIPRHELTFSNYIGLSSDANSIMVDTFRRFHNLAQIWSSAEFLTYRDFNLSSTISNYAHFSRSIVPQRLETFPHECPLLTRIEEDSLFLEYRKDGNHISRKPNFHKLSSHLLDQVHTFELDLRTEELLSSCNPLCRFHHYSTGMPRAVAVTPTVTEFLNSSPTIAQPHVCLCRAQLPTFDDTMIVYQEPSESKFLPHNLVDETRLSQLSREIVLALPHLREQLRHWNRLFRESNNPRKLIGQYLNRDILALVLLPAIADPP